MPLPPGFQAVLDFATIKRVTRRLCGQSYSHKSNELEEQGPILLKIMNYQNSQSEIHNLDSAITPQKLDL
jgi:hypothetical protein